MPPRELVILILAELLTKRSFQVPGYKNFDYSRMTDNAVILLREAGDEARIPLRKLRIAVESVQKDPTIYTDGPASLRKHGLTHVTSPLWAMLHLVPAAFYR